jgi:hypothetical protein
MADEVRHRRQEMGTWVKFCKQKIEKIEKVWNKKLEDTSTGDDSDDDATDKQAAEHSDEDIEENERLDKLIQNMRGDRVLSRSNIEHIRKNDEET